MSPCTGLDASRAAREKSGGNALLRQNWNKERNGDEGAALPSFHFCPHVQWGNKAWVGQSPGQSPGCLCTHVSVQVERGTSEAGEPVLQLLQRASICVCAQAERGTAEMGPGELQLIREMYLSPVFKASGNTELDLGAQGMYLSSSPRQVATRIEI